MDRLRHRTTLGWGDSAHENVFRSFYLDSRTESSVGKAQDYIGGNTAQIKRILGEGTPHIHC